MRKDDVIHRWWPATQSLDLVEGDPQTVARAVQAECTRFWENEPVAGEWKQYATLDEAFAAAPDFRNVPTRAIAIPTRSDWTVLWNNSFLCDGYDSLCWCLTTHHGLRTIHWSAHDTLTTFQAGASFCVRRREHAAVVERSVHCAQEDKRWIFQQFGDPLPQENLSAYTAKQKRDRLNETELLAFLERLGARPWVEDFYAVADEPVFVLRRLAPPAMILMRSREDVLAGGKL